MTYETIFALIIVATLVIVFGSAFSDHRLPIKNIRYILTGNRPVTQSEESTANSEEKRVRVPRGKRSQKPDGSPMVRSSLTLEQGRQKMGRGITHALNQAAAEAEEKRARRRNRPRAPDGSRLLENGMSFKQWSAKVGQELIDNLNRNALAEAGEREAELQEHRRIAREKAEIRQRAMQLRSQFGRDARTRDDMS